MVHMTSSRLARATNETILKMDLSVRRVCSHGESHSPSPASLTERQSIFSKGRFALSG